LKKIEQKCEEDSAFEQEIQNIHIQNIQNNNSYTNNGNDLIESTITGNLTINNK